MSDAHPDPPSDGPEPDPTTRSPYSRHGTPAPLAVAAGLTFVEGLLTFLFGVAEVLSLDSDRLAMGADHRAVLPGVRRRAARLRLGDEHHPPVVARSGAARPADLAGPGLELPRAATTLPIAIGLAVVAVVVLAGLLHPRSIDALEQAADRG